MSDDRRRAPSRTWRETAAQASDEVIAIRERLAIADDDFGAPSRHRLRADLRTLLAEIDRLRETQSTMRKGCRVLITRAIEASAEDMRRRAVEVCRKEEARLQALADRPWGMEPNCERYGVEAADRLADKIADLPLLADGETSGSGGSAALGEEREG